MPLVSMTGFARATGSGSGIDCVWEIRSVNGKGLDARLRLAPGFEGVEVDARAIIQKAFGRGNINATLSIIHEVGGGVPTINEAALAAFVERAQNLAKENREIAAPTADGLLGLKGVIETSDGAISEDELAAQKALVLDVLRAATTSLATARQEEGNRTTAVIEQMVSKIADLSDQAAVSVEQQRDVLRERKSEAVRELLADAGNLDSERLEQEVAILYTKADVREELDRLQTHVSQARELVGATEPVGRRFDFLCQELNREANTLCSKAAIGDLSRIGLDLKIVIDQLREQVQNIE